MTRRNLPSPGNAEGGSPSSGSPGRPNLLQGAEPPLLQSQQKKMAGDGSDGIDRSFLHQMSVGLPELS